MTKRDNKVQEPIKLAILSYILGVINLGTISLLMIYSLENNLEFILEILIIIVFIISIFGIWSGVFSFKHENNTTGKRSRKFAVWGITLSTLAIIGTLILIIYIWELTFSFR